MAKSSDSSDSLLRYPVAELLAMVASADTPVPAGGSVAALVGAASAALLVLVCQALARRKVPVDVSAWLPRAAALQTRLTALIDGDAVAYRNLMAVRKLPRRDANEETTRRVALHQALSRATHTPLEIAVVCAQVVRVAEQVEAIASGPITSDARIARQLATAALHASLDTAEENLPSVTEPVQRIDLEREINALRADWPPA